MAEKKKMIDILGLTTFLSKIRSETEQKISALNIPSKLSDLSEDVMHRTVTDVEKNKWNEKAKIIQSSWNETDVTSGAFIKNKPTKLTDFENDIPLATFSQNGLMSATDKQILSDFDGAISDSFIESLFATIDGNIITTQSEVESISTDEVVTLFS